MRQNTLPGGAMRHGLVAAALAAALGLGGRAFAQANLADEIILLSKGQRNKEKVLSGTALGGMPGAGDNTLGPSPGAGGSLLGSERSGLILNPFIGLVTQEPKTGGAAGSDSGSRLSPPAKLPARRVPLYGPLELGTDDEGSADGLTIEQAVAHLVETNPDLAAKFQEIPKAQAERTPDVFFLYSPYELTNNGPTGGRNTSSWGVSGLVTLPVFNRNQGNIRRAQVDVNQTQIQLQAIERQAAGEVARAAVEAEAASSAVRRFETAILPKARAVRDSQFKLFETGQEGVSGYLNAQRDFNEVARQYLEALARRRRAVLKVNTAVGSRILP